MKILHYFLGFPPFRTGGLTKFAYDLMCSQIEKGNYVVALYPGKMNFFINRNKVGFKKKKDISGIKNYEIINPLPVSLDEGIIEIEKYTKKNEVKKYLDFLNKIKPEVIHIHTLMGLHKEFIEAANLCKIKIIYTAHDYFGICPKVTLYRYGEVCDNNYECKECIRCNYSALPIDEIRLMQSPLYRKIKNLKLVKIIRKKHRESFFTEKQPEFKENNNEIRIKQEEYQKLKKYYTSILESVDIIHFNSNLTKQIYEKHFNVKKSKVISITHKDIKDNRNIKHIDSEKIRFTFLASTKPYKGIYLIKKVLDELYEEKRYEFELNVYGNVINPSPYMNIHENGFEQEDLTQIFAKTDILLAPSIWYETFGFTVLEALSYGIPVIISDNVGAKDIVKNAGVIVKSNNVGELKKVLESITKDKINEFRSNIKNLKIKEWNEFSLEIENLYGE